MALKHDIFALALRALSATGAHRLLAPAARGCGVIVMLHRVCPARNEAFAPNALLEITPGFLDTALTALAEVGFDLLSLDDALPRIAQPGARPFAVLTFDDGYRDTLDEALPVLRKHGAPATVYVTPGFADRTAPLWWIDLERTVAKAGSLVVMLDGVTTTLACRTPVEKRAAFDRIYWDLRRGPEERLRAVIADLAAGQGIDSPAITGELCLDWDGVRTLAADPLITIGAHTLTHPMLAKHADAVARDELDMSRHIVAREIERPVRHVAYPVGDPGSAGAREFAMARDLGFSSGVTTRPGMVFPGHADHLLALPRLSLNGLFQSRDQLDVLLSGVPFLLWNRGRRLNVA